MEKIRKRIAVMIDRQRAKLKKEIEEYEKKQEEGMVDWGYGGSYHRKENAIRKREKSLKELNDLEKQLDGLKQYRKVMAWTFTCRDCGAVTIVNKPPFNDWHECPACRQMIHLDHVPNIEIEVTDATNLW